jgi:hypothetical protein
MAINDDISAQVSVRPEYAQELAEIMRFFENGGFAIAVPFAGNFAISGPRTLFQQVFQTDVDGNVSQLPLHALPESVCDKIAAIVLSRVDFGPQSY